MRRTKEMKKGLKRGLAMVLSATMVLGIAPMVPGNVSRVQAEESEESGLKATVYATKEQLMNFSPDNSAKLVFGKNDQGNAQEWYVLGKDDGVAGDNTAIFAAGPIIEHYIFDSSNDGEKTYKESNGTYINGNPTKIYVNHYGASELREMLQEMVSANNTTYFSATENSLMQETTITTFDTKNRKDYTTSDKLYAFAADKGSSCIKIGSNNNKILPSGIYWKGGDNIWSRSPYDKEGFFTYALYTHMSYNSIDNNDIRNNKRVRPASNLNLSSVLFASAAPTSGGEASGEIADGTAMTLRLDGSDKNIGTVIYSNFPHR